jgi:hypothetical protein
VYARRVPPNAAISSAAVTIASTNSSRSFPPSASPTTPPRIAPAIPAPIVQSQPIGWIPGRTSRASAPITRPTSTHQRSFSTTPTIATPSAIMTT